MVADCPEPTKNYLNYQVDAIKRKKAEEVQSNLEARKFWKKELQDEKRAREEREAAEAAAAAAAEELERAHAERVPRDQQEKAAEALALE